MDQIRDFAVVILGSDSTGNVGDTVALFEHVGQMFVNWLQDSAGGGLPKDQVFIGPSEVVDRAFEEVLRAVGRRLYIYVVGRGSQGPSGELLLKRGVDLSELLKRGVDLPEHGGALRIDAYADHFQSIASFEEVVLIADFGSTAASGFGYPRTPPWPLVSKKTRAPLLSMSCVTQEPGIFTQVLLDGLSGAAAGNDGAVTSETLRSYVSARFSSLAPQALNITFDGQKPFIFVSARSESPKVPSERKTYQSERVASQADAPATVDALDRRPFARVIGQRIEEVRETGNGAAFMVHIHGPWGSGKTSVLNFLKEYLQGGGRTSPRWIVVEFNAWQRQRIRPPWWTLITTVYSGSINQLDAVERLKLRFRWRFWRSVVDWIPTLSALMLVIVAVFLTAVVIPSLFPQPVARTGASGEFSKSLLKAIEQAFKLITTGLAAVGAIYAISRSLVFGSPRAAKAYTTLRSDPMSPIVWLFEKLVDAIKKPVVIFIDDLDRCESKYVIDLLEGIQTLFRTKPVTYVVAADRKWIRSSFESGYRDFTRPIGEPGRPLGHLFLDKVFQVSAAIPSLSAEVKETYWYELLSVGGTGGPKSLETVRAQAESEAEEIVRGVHTRKELQAKIEEAKDLVQQQALRAAAALQITRPEAQAATEHSLQRYAGMLEANPRAMKRLVNAYGMAQATHFLEGRTVRDETLVRWTIIELRWPLLSDLLSTRPQFAAKLLSPLPEDDLTVPKNLRLLFGDEDVKAVIATEGSLILDEAAIREVIGLTTQPAFFRTQTAGK
jgi:hypothetical protein